MEETSPETFIGKIYRIWSPNTDKVYIGSTCRDIRRRFTSHNVHRKRWMQGKCTNTCTSFEILAHGDAKIEIIEEDEFLDKQHMLEREKYWINKLNTVNKFSPMRTYEERRRYNNENKKKNYNTETVRRYNRTYKINNKEKVKELNNKSASMRLPCETCGILMRRDCLRRHMQRKHALTEENK